MDSDPGEVRVIDGSARERFSGLEVDFARLVELLPEPFDDGMDGNDIGAVFASAYFGKRRYSTRYRGQSSRSE